MKTLPECYPASLSCTTRLTIFTIGTFLGLSLVVACSDFMVILIGPLLLLCCCCGWTDTDHHDTTTDEWQYYFETLKIIILFTPHHHHGQNAVCGLYEVLTVDQQWSGGYFCNTGWHFLCMTDSYFVVLAAEEVVQVVSMRKNESPIWDTFIVAFFVAQELVNGERPYYYWPLCEWGEGCWECLGGMLWFCKNIFLVFVFMSLCHLFLWLL